MFEALLSNSLAKVPTIRATNLRMRISEKNSGDVIYLAEWSFIDVDGNPLTAADYDMSGVSASSQYAPDWGPQWAFDGRIEDGGSTPQVRWQTNNPGEQWITIGFNREVEIKAYRIHVGITSAMNNNTTYSLRKWVLETRNQQGSYDLIHTVENQTRDLWALGPYREFTFSK